MSPLNEQQRKARTQELIRTQKRAEILAWYLANNNNAPPLVQCEDKKSYKGKILWYLEPPIPNVTNPRLVEEYIGDSWALYIEALD